MFISDENEQLYGIDVVNDSHNDFHFQSEGRFIGDEGCWFDILDNLIVGGVAACRNYYRATQKRDAIKASMVVIQYPELAWQDSASLPRSVDAIRLSVAVSWIP